MKTTTRWTGAFTIVEVLLVISVISIIGSAAYYTISSSRENARESKLEADVASLNSAAQVYLANGGNLPPELTGDQALRQLKKRADAATAASAIGLKESVIDARVWREMQSSEEAASDQLRARWDGPTRRFVLTREGGSGIKQFTLDPNLAAQAPETEARDNHLVAATETQWIWDYSDPADNSDPSSGSPISPSPSGSPTPLPSATPTPTPVPVRLEINLAVAKNTLTYEEAGGPMLGQDPVTPTPATVNLLSTQIPPAYLNSGKFQIYYTLDGTDPLASATAMSGPDFSGTFVPTQIDVSISRWGTASSLTVKAAAKAIDRNFFESSSVKTETITITPMPLAAPEINPASGARPADQSISITLASNTAYPTAARIFYTTDGSAPTTSSTLYSGPFALAENANTVKARVYGPVNYEQWFTPSNVAEAEYLTVNVPEGALVGNATVNGTFYGSVIYTNQMNNLPQYINFNSGAKILQGNVYFPGTPNFNFNGSMNTIIQGNNYDAAGNIIPPNTDRTRVVDLDGSIQPANYTVTFNSGALIEGKVYRRATPPVMPTVANPPNPSNSNNYTLNGGSATISATQYANANINSGTLTLNPGNYGNFNVGGTLVLGVPGATTPSVYNFQGMNLNSGSKVVIVGPVVLTMRYGLNANSEIGNVANPDWLQLQMANGDFTMNSSAKVYAKVVAPNNTVNLNGTFNGSVAAKTLVINGNGIAFTLPPVVSGN